MALGWCWWSGGGTGSSTTWYNQCPPTVTSPLPCYILCNRRDIRHQRFCLEPHDHELRFSIASSVYLSGFSVLYGCNVFTADFSRVEAF